MKLYVLLLSILFLFPLGSAYGASSCGWLLASQKLVRKINDYLAPVAQVSKKGQLQERIWSLQEAGQDSETQVLQRMVYSELKAGKVIKVAPLKVKLGEKAIVLPDARLLHFADGMRAIFKFNPKNPEKAMQDAAHEVFAYELDHLIGLNIVPTTVARELYIYGLGFVYGSVQLFVSGDMAFNLRHQESYAERISKIHFLDFIIANYDRTNGSNYLIQESGRQVAIDNAYSFTQEFDEYSDFMNIGDDFFKYYPGARVHQRLKHLKAQELENILSPLSLREKKIFWQRLIYYLNRFERELPNMTTN